MSDMRDPPEPDELPPDVLRAMEWALGTLDDAERREAELRRRSDPAFRALCDRWADRLAAGADEPTPVAPPPDVWNRIEAAIDPPAIAPAMAPEASRPKAGRGVWNSLFLWRGATAAFAALALALLVTRPPAPPAASAPAPDRPALLASTLAPESGSALVTVAVDPDRRSLVVMPVANPDADGRVPELWLIPADGTPRSLGVIELGGARRLEVPPTILELVADGATLAVSLEPVGGSPTGQPTGPVIATGRLARI